jgi:hypothetical protein
MDERLAKAIEYLKRVNQAAWANDFDRQLRNEIEDFIAECSTDTSKGVE